VLDRHAAHDPMGRQRHGLRQTSARRHAPRQAGAACWAAYLSPPRPPVATPDGPAGVLAFNQTHADEPAVPMHSLDGVAIELEIADHGRWEVMPGGALRGQRQGLLTRSPQTLKRKAMLRLNERHPLELSAPPTGASSLSSA
jgi:hypothetical protein